jgi:hypothetical protein
MKEGRKEGRREGRQRSRKKPERRKEGKGAGRKKGRSRKEGRKELEGRKEGRKEGAGRSPTPLLCTHVVHWAEHWYAIHNMQYANAQCHNKKSLTKHSGSRTHTHAYTI